MWYRTIDYNKNMITEIANDGTFGDFTLTFLQGMQLFLSLKV